MDLSKCKRTDPRSIQLEALTDISDVNIDTSLPPEERLMDYLKQIKNPYCFRCGAVVVQISYADTTLTLEDALEQFIRQRQIAQHGCL